MHKNKKFRGRRLRRPYTFERFYFPYMEYLTSFPMNEKTTVMKEMLPTFRNTKLNSISNFSLDTYKNNKLNKKI